MSCAVPPELFTHASYNGDNRRGLLTLAFFPLLMDYFISAYIHARTNRMLS